MASAIYDSNQNRIGHLEHDGDQIVARDVEGREIGRYDTAVQAVSACHRAWREPAIPTEYDEQMIFERIASRMKAGTND